MVSDLGWSRIKFFGCGRITNYITKLLISSKTNCSVSTRGQLWVKSKLTSMLKTNVSFYQFQDHSRTACQLPLIRFIGLLLGSTSVWKGYLTSGVTTYLAQWHTKPIPQGFRQLKPRRPPSCTDCKSETRVSQAAACWLGRGGRALETTSPNRENTSLAATSAILRRQASSAAQNSTWRTAPAYRPGGAVRIDLATSLSCLHSPYLGTNCVRVNLVGI